MERLRQRVLMPFENVRVGSNDCLHFRSLVIRERAADLDRVDLERSSVRGRVGEVL